MKTNCKTSCCNHDSSSNHTCKWMGLLLAEILVAAVIFGGGCWISEKIDGNTDAEAWNFALRGLVFGLVYVPVSHWLRRKDKEVEK